MKEIRKLTLISFIFDLDFFSLQSVIFMSASATKIILLIMVCCLWKQASHNIRHLYSRTKIEIEANKTKKHENIFIFSMCKFIVHLNKIVHINEWFDILHWLKLKVYFCQSIYLNCKWRYMGAKRNHQNPFLLSKLIYIVAEKSIKCFDIRTDTIHPFQNFRIYSNSNVVSFVFDVDQNPSFHSTTFEVIPSCLLLNFN